MSDSEELMLACRPARDVVMTRETLVLPDGYETLLLHHKPLRPGGPPVLYVHGIQSHPGWFVRSAQALARAGSEVFQVTRRGSGTATNRRGHAASAGQLMRDVEAAVRRVLEATGAGRLAMLGVSWGGKLLTAYALAPAESRQAVTAECVDSLTLVAPGIAPLVDVSAATKLAILAARCFSPTRRFDIPLNDVSLFTENPAMREYLRNDPHRLHRASAAFMFASAMLDRLIARAADGALNIPTTLILAGRDRIIDNDATREALDRLTAGGVRVCELDAAHTIEFEPDPRPFHEILRQGVKGTDVLSC